MTETALRHLDPAYVITVHKAQGSSFDVVIIPHTMRFSVKLTRNMLYTAISRAKKHVIFVGDRSVLDYALATPEPGRNSVLVDQVQDKLYLNAG